MEHITITPDYEHMFRTMIQDAGTQSNPRCMFDDREPADRAELMRQVQRWFAPLTIAANCATSVAAIERLREVMSGMLSGIDREAQRLESAHDEHDTPEGQRGIL
jgi:hypothetical protein